MSWDKITEQQNPVSANIDKNSTIDILKIINKPDVQYNIEIKRSYFPNGNIEYEAEYLNGKLDGLSRVWHKDGTLFSESEYSNGQPHGVWKKYFPNNNIMYEASYEFGNKHGNEKWFYETGRIKSEQNFINGNAKLDITRWKPDGTLIY